jgi:hypothetical protein
MCEAISIQGYKCNNPHEGHKTHSFEWIVFENRDKNDILSEIKVTYYTFWK